MCCCRSMAFSTCRGTTSSITATTSKPLRSLMKTRFSHRFSMRLNNTPQLPNATFACTAHQGGQFFRKHPAGRQFFDFFGETLFRDDSDRVHPRQCRVGAVG
ncbi:hypothetical protein [Pseudomonas sp.]|uniref:hypothetical protein n=1 Tax=Pseudomonas sp. TaxID=306 RepID=UPI003390748E